MGKALAGELSCKWTGPVVSMPIWLKTTKKKKCFDSQSYRLLNWVYLLIILFIGKY